MPQIENPVFFIIGCVLIIFAGYKLFFDNAPPGHEDDDGFHYD